MYNQGLALLPPPGVLAPRDRGPTKAALLQPGLTGQTRSSPMGLTPKSPPALRPLTQPPHTEDVSLFILQSHVAAEAIIATPLPPISPKPPGVVGKGMLETSRITPVDPGTRVHKEGQGWKSPEVTRCCCLHLCLPPSLSSPAGLRRQGPWRDQLRELLCAPVW